MVNSGSMAFCKYNIDVLLKSVWKLEPPDRSVVDNNIGPNKFLYFFSRIVLVVDICYLYFKVGIIFKKIKSFLCDSFVEPAAGMAKFLTTID